MPKSSHPRFPQFVLHRGHTHLIHNNFVANLVFSGIPTYPFQHPYFSYFINWRENLPNKFFLLKLSFSIWRIFCPLIFYFILYGIWNSLAHLVQIHIVYDPLKEKMMSSKVSTSHYSNPKLLVKVVIISTSSWFQKLKCKDSATILIHFLI